MKKYKTYSEPTATTSKGISYDIPCGIDDSEFIKLIEEFVTYAKLKGLTIRQAQFLFEACQDYILESKLG